MENKKVLTVLLGSPRKNGNSEQLADALARGAAENGYEVRRIRLAGLNIKGCTDCRRCWNNGKPCVQHDDMETINKDLLDADVIVFASPLYYYSWSSYIKPVWDRLLPFFAPNAPQNLKGKRAVLLSAAGDTDEKCFEGLKASFRLACEFCCWEIAAEICAPDMYPKTDMAEKGASFLDAAYKTGKSL